MTYLEMNEAEAWDVLELAVGSRYGIEAVDFMCAFEEGTAESRYPGCEDLLELAEWLGDQ
jgi:hypothetical protein